MKRDQEKFYVLYLDLRGKSRRKSLEIIDDMRAIIDRELRRKGERWLILPSDRDELNCVDPIVLEGEEASSFIEKFEETREKIYKKLGLDKT